MQKSVHFAIERLHHPLSCIKYVVAVCKVFFTQIDYQHTVKLFIQSRDLMAFTVQNYVRLDYILCNFGLHSILDLRDRIDFSKTLQNAMPSPNCNLA